MPDDIRRTERTPIQPAPGETREAFIARLQEHEAAMGLAPAATPAPPALPCARCAGDLAATHNGDPRPEHRTSTTAALGARLEGLHPAERDELRRDTLRALLELRSYTPAPGALTLTRAIELIASEPGRGPLSLDVPTAADR